MITRRVRQIRHVFPLTLITCVYARARDVDNIEHLSYLSHPSRNRED